MNDKEFMVEKIRSAYTEARHEPVHDRAGLDRERRKIAPQTRCVKGHYVCNDCHTRGMDSIFGLCLAETSRDPIAILEKMMSVPFCHMHGPEHPAVHPFRSEQPVHRQTMSLCRR